MDPDEYSQIYIKIIRLLGRREYSQLELNQKLIQKGFDKNIIKSVLAECVKNNYQSDERFTQSYVRYCVNNGKGPIWIQYKLVQKGISVERIEQVLIGWENKWDALIKQLYIRRFGEEKVTDSQVYQKRYRFLVSRGFTPNQIKSVLF